jgi:hypothetical protein
MEVRNLLKRLGPRPLPLLIQQSAKALETVSELQQYVETGDGAAAQRLKLVGAEADELHLLVRPLCRWADLNAAIVVRLG